MCLLCQKCDCFLFHNFGLMPVQWFDMCLCWMFIVFNCSDMCCASFCIVLVRTVIVCTRCTSCLVLFIFLTITFDFPSYIKQTMGQTKEGHAQVLASLRDTGGMQVSDSVVRQCVFA